MAGLPRLFSCMVRLKKATNDNVTRDYPDTLSEYLQVNTPYILYTVGISIGCIILLALSLILGTISWIKIGPWRQFKNYVFLNVTLSLFLMHITYAGCIMNGPCCGLIQTVTFRIAMSAFANWLLIMYMAIYTKILKVFSGNLQHKYIKANAFAWGMAALECAFHQLMATESTPNAGLNVAHAMTYVIIGFYLSVIYALVKLITGRMISSENFEQIVNIFWYVTSAFIILILSQAMFYLPDLYDYFYLGIGFMEAVLVINYWSIKAHRELWDDYMKGKKDVSYEDETRPY